MAEGGKVGEVVPAAGAVEAETRAAEVAKAEASIAPDTTPEKGKPAAAVKTTAGDVTIDRTHDVPLLGGSNGKGVVYLDKHFEPIKTIGGKQVDVTPFLAEHEAVEAKLEREGKSYTDAHAAATTAEHALVKKAGIAPQEYEAALHPDIAAAGKKEAPQVPPDIITKPYEHPHTAAQRKMLGEVEKTPTPGSTASQPAARIRARADAAKQPGLKKTLGMLADAIEKSDLPKLHEIIGNTANKQSRAAFTEETGVKLPRGGKNTRAAIDAWAAQERARAEGKPVEAAALESVAHPENPAPEPTPAQHEANNFKQGHVNLHGLDITIQVPKGGMRRGTDKSGTAWEREASDHYGHIRGTNGGDGEPHDVYLGPHAEDANAKVFVIRQVKPGTDAFDESKAMIGYDSGKAARRSYDANFPKGLKVFGGIKEMSIDEFKASLNGEAKPPVSKLAAAEASGRAAIEQQHAENRAALAREKFKPGDAVKFTNAVGREVEGTITKKRDVTKLSDIGQIVVEHPGRGGVATSTVGASKLTRVERAPEHTEAKQVAAVADEVEPEKPDTSKRNTEDAGEELWANRRNSTGKGLSWEDAKDLNATLKSREVVKAKVWPRPNYEQLVAEGMPAEVAHVIKQVYDAVAGKPVTRLPSDAQYQSYVEGLHKLRDATFAWARDVVENHSGKLDHLEVKGFEEKPRVHAMLEALFPYSGDYQGRFRGATDASKANNTLANLLGGNKLVHALQPRTDALNEAIRAVAKGWPAPQEMWEKRFEVRQRGDEWQVVGKAGRGFRRVHADGLASKEAAIEKARELAATKKGGDGAKPEPPVKLQNARQGPPRRAANEDVTSDHLKDTFGFRGVNFGNWMKGEGAKNAVERQAHLNHAYDSMMDLAEIMNVPPKALSLNGTLGVAFGAQGTGGKKGAAAHFVPGVNEINLTREHGAGSLAHEWAHAFDHYLAAQAEGKVAIAKNPFLTENTGTKSPTIRPEIVKAFKTIVDTMKTRPETPAERDTRIEKLQSTSQTGLDRDLTTLRTDLDARMKKESNSADVHTEFDSLAARLRAGDLGDGYVTTGKGRMDAAPQVVGLLHNLYKDAVGAKPAEYVIGRIGHLARTLAALKDMDSTTHQPQQVKSEFLKEANKLEGTRTTPYWASTRELFARAFQSYVLDKLATGEAHNDYLTRPQMSAEKRAELLADPVMSQLIETGDRYPRGVERERINAAFDTLVGTIEHKETEGGNVAMFRVGDHAATEPTAAEEAHYGKINRAVQDTRKTWGDNAPNVRVIATAEGLPREAKASKDYDYRKASGFIDRDGTVYVVANKHATADEALRSLAHEVMGHFGVNNIIDQHVPGGWEKLTRDMERLRADPNLGSKAFRDVLNTVERKYTKKDGTKADPTTFAQEALAIAAERGIRNGLIGRAIAAVRAWVRKMFPSLRLSEREMLQLLTHSENFIRARDSEQSRAQSVPAMNFTKDGDTFYSALHRSVLEAKGAPKKGGDALKQWLDGAQRRGEFKGSERQWLGVDQWLESHPDATRQELADFVRANQVEVTPVKHGGGQSAELPDGWSVTNEGARAGYVVRDEDGHEQGFGETRAEALVNAQDIDERADQPTKFGTYVLPGGENYREHLLTLPEQAGAPRDLHITKSSDGWFEVRDKNDGEAALRSFTSKDQAEGYIVGLGKEATKKVNFKGGHFDEPNILAHVRMNDRTTADGKSALHIEELQSDWAQKGRREGFKRGMTPAEIAAQKSFDESAARGENAGDWRAANPEHTRSLSEMFARDRANAVPDMPLKNTEDWAMLGFKHALREAVETGKDKVTWTTGEQQAERYDLSKQVDKIVSTPTGEKTRSVRIAMKNDQQHELHVNKDGIVDGDASGLGAKGKPLSDVIGKDLADKVMMASERATLSGNDLKIGGAGMRGFYDKILPKAVEKYVKQWGGKVGESKITTEPGRVRGEESFGGPPGSYKPRQDTTVHSVDITPAMRESVREGQPLFDQADRAGMNGATDKATLADAARQWKENGTDSPYFRRFFGEGATGSKVVDAKGEPLVVHHGTADDFTEFKDAHAGASTGHMTAPLGHFFDEQRSQAKRYAEKASGGVPADERVIDAYLNIRNPKDMTLKQFMAIDGQDEARAIKAKLQAQGFDGIKLNLDGRNQWIAFDSSQIKSTEGRGTFDAGSKNINFALGEHVDYSKPSANMETLSEVLSKPDEGMFDRAKAWMRGKAEDFRPAALGALQRRHVTELMDNHPALKSYGKSYDERVQQLEADRSQMLAGAPDAAQHPTDMLKRGGATIAEDLRKYAFEKGPAGWFGRRNPETKALADVMHVATLHGIDPSEEYSRIQMEDRDGKFVPWTPQTVKERIAALRGQMRGRPGDDKRVMMDEIKSLRNLKYREAARTRAWPDLVAAYQKLSPEAKGLYKQQRDWYAQVRDETEKGLIARVEAFGRDIAAVGGGDEMRRRFLLQTIQRIRLQFEMNRQEGVYFPLNRDGDFWISFADKDGAQGFKMFETAAAAAAAEKKLRASGFRVEAQGRRDGNYRAKNAPTGTFVADVIGILKKAHAPESVQDEIYQTFLRSLPEMSMRKHSIHRKKVPGFSEDILRTFSKNAFHGAHQLARLRHAHELQAILDAAQMSMDNYRRSEDVLGGQSSDSGALDVARGDALLGELKKRHDYMMSPKDTQLANVANSIGFLYHLGASPASALTNLTQNAQVTLPVLGAHHGWLKASRMLGATMRDALRTGGNIDRTLSNPEERRAYNVLRARGDIDKTQTHTLAALAEGNQLQSNPLYARPLAALGYMFHKAEVINREAAGMAAYRLGRSSGKSFEDAVQYASDIINGTHFDYSASNRSRIMQGNAARIALQFKNYSLGMTWMMYRNLYQTFKGETPEIRRVALKTFTGIMGTTALMAGTMGLPMINAIKYTANAAHALFGDDEPFDFDVEYQKWLAENLGEDAAKYVATGAVNQITGANLASRVSLSNLWFQDADRELEGKDAYYAMLESLAGPIGGIAKNLFVGTKMVADGNAERGIETMMPKFAKDAMKALRFAHDGANSLRGDPIVPDVSTPEQFIQGLGFTPTRLAEQQKQNSALENYQSEIQQQRQRLLNAYAMAVRSGDDRDIAMEKIHAFNAQYPEIAIKSESIRQSLRARARYSAEARGGIVLNKKIAARVRDMAGADDYSTPAP